MVRLARPDTAALRRFKEFIVRDDNPTSILGASSIPSGQRQRKLLGTVDLGAFNASSLVRVASYVFQEITPPTTGFTESGGVQPSGQVEFALRDSTDTPNPDSDGVGLNGFTAKDSSGPTAVNAGAAKASADDVQGGGTVVVTRGNNLKLDAYFRIRNLSVVTLVPGSWTLNKFEATYVVIFLPV